MSHLDCLAAPGQNRPRASDPYQAAPGNTSTASPFHTRRCLRMPRCAVTALCCKVRFDAAKLRVDGVKQLGDVEHLPVASPNV
jgi:hypothetical protein